MFTSASGLDDEAHHTVARGLVAALLTFELIHSRALHAGGLPPGSACAIELGNGLVVREMTVRNLALNSFGGNRIEQRGGSGGVERGGGSAGTRRHRSSAGFIAGTNARRGARFAHRRVVVERTEQLAHEPYLVLNRIVAPRAAKHDELDLVRGVPHLRKRRQPRRDL